jgi:hypothetical protein
LESMMGNVKTRIFLKSGPVHISISLDLPRKLDI